MLVCNLTFGECIFGKTERKLYTCEAFLVSTIGGSIVSLTTVLAGCSLCRPCDFRRFLLAHVYPVILGCLLGGRQLFQMKITYEFVGSSLVHG